MNAMATLSLKADAQRYFFGYLWWILEPLLWVGVFYFVFEVLLGTGRTDFLVFLAVGKLTFIWFSKSVNQSANSLLLSSGLISKMDAPKWLFPLAICHEGLYKQVAVLALLIVLLLYKGYVPSAAWLWLVPLAATQYLLIVGCGMLAALLVCVRHDFQLLVQLGMVFLLFMSGIFWDIDSIGSAALRESLLLVNPLASIIDLYRTILIEGTAPPLTQWLIVLFESVVILTVVVWAYRALHYWIARRVVIQ
jgi:lipopolysaccharide transport system permease protein